MQHREIQGHESDKFLSYFKPCIIPLEGGIASGFKKPEEEEFETRLYVCRGKRVVRKKVKGKCVCCLAQNLFYNWCVFYTNLSYEISIDK